MVIYPSTPLSVWKTTPQVLLVRISEFENKKIHESTKLYFRTNYISINSFVSAFRRVLIIIDLEVLQKGEEVGMEMGKPINFDSMDSAKTNSGTLKHVSTSPVDLHAKIAQLEAQNSQQQAEIDAKDAKIAEQNRKISELVAKIADHGVKIEKLEVSIGEMLHSLPNA